MRHWWEVKVVNAGQEPGPRLGPVADISINSYESRIERTARVRARARARENARCYADTWGATRSFARTLQPKDMNANALRSVRRSKEFPAREEGPRIGSEIARRGEATRARAREKEKRDARLAAPRR